MKLSEADKQKILAWLNTKCGPMRCTCCGLGQWTLVDICTLTIGHDIHTTRFHYHEGIPQVTVACNNCGHMIFFNPAIMGFKPDQPPQASEVQPTNT